MTPTADTIVSIVFCSIHRCFLQPKLDPFLRLSSPSPTKNVRHTQGVAISRLASAQVRHVVHTDAASNTHPSGRDGLTSTKKAKTRHDRSAGGARIARRSVGDFLGAPRPLLEIEPEPLRAGLLSHGAKQLGCAASVDAYAVLMTFTDLDPSRGQLDEPFHHVGLRTMAAIRMPELFPDLVRFPIISGVEKLRPTEEPGPDRGASSSGELNLAAVRPNECPCGERVG